MKKTVEVDVIIVGGGIVGLTLAVALASQQKSVALINSESLTHTPHKKDEYELRVSAITRASQRVFENLGVWPDILAQRVSPFREMKVWDAAGTGHIHFSAQQLAEPYLGHIIENNVIIQALLDKFQSLPHGQLFAPACPINFAQTESQAIVTLDDNRVLIGKLLVGADGGQSWVREQLDFPMTTRAYGHHAIVATVTHSMSHLATASQRFLSSGPLAFLPLSDAKTSSIVWSCLPEVCNELMSLSDEDFNIRLAENFAFRLGDIMSVSRRLQFPLIMRHAKQYVKNQVALIGDAAHTIHPLAGQGVNLGILDAACLSEVLIDTEQAFASYSCLRRYERWRKGHNALMIATMQGFKQLFGTEQTIVKWLRNTGLNLTNQCPGLKNKIMQHAMGLSGDLPKLASSSAIN